MKLLKLSSDNSNFKSFSFNPGMTVIAGLQKSTKNDKTYNGVGKSSTLNLLHLLLGGKLPNKTVRDKKVAKFLKNYGTFFLSFEHDNVSYLVSKNFSQNYYQVNGTKYSHKKYLEFLTETFITDRKLKGLSFRQLINCFARKYGGKYYEEAHTQQGMAATDYNQRLVNFILLGIDTSLVRKKLAVKKSIDSLKKSMKAVESLIIRDESLNLKDLKEQLSELEAHKESLEIAQAFDKHKKLADKLTANINEFRDDLFKSRNEIMRKRNLLNQISEVDIDLEQLTSVYEEAELFFANDVQVYLEDACNFHKKLLQDRTHRLSQEIANLSDHIDELKITLEPIEERRDSLLKYLNSEGAFEEYDSVTNQILTLSNEINTAESNIRLSKSIEKNLASEVVKNASIQSQAIDYLSSISPTLENLDNRFRAIVKRFYDNNGGEIRLSVSKDAQYLYDLDVHVPRDSSQGVNEVRVFCYDLFLYELNKDALGFLAHDGCIFSELDPKHKSMMFKLILEYIADLDLQYFLNIGQSSLDEVLSSDLLDPDEKRYIKDSIKLNLYDDDPSSWLFGESFG
ncbi:DUF2326 domain-containing protein [Vibrio jasicida]|uniref:DUF2326 domain-containing protein n=1 Tax=Vibrio jasicida TaxID=766224 RepID=UPI00148B6D8D|nr:DUF2326 domain-containing protein [Vibrio jasicida]NOJ19770.1 DUF2326 domain-containing protein [Vibrio jasicida]